MSAATTDKLTGSPQSVSTESVMRGLLRYLRVHARSSIVFPNVFVGRNPWECDVIKVSSAYFWVEFEVKISMQDYRADFRKRQFRWRSDSLSKHEAYSCSDPIEMRSPYTNRVGVIPKPKQFYFVTPKGMLDGVDVPSHCGLIEFDEKNKRSWGMDVVRVAPNLKSPTRLKIDQVFDLAKKASHRLRLPSEYRPTNEVGGNKQSL